MDAASGAIQGKGKVDVMEDYKLRMINEYKNLKEKYNKLHKMLVKYDAGKLDFTPTCPIDLLKKQASIMGQYLYILETRAVIEGVNLNEEGGEKDEATDDLRVCKGNAEQKGEMMTNREKYKDVIKRMTRRYPPLHPAVINGKVVPCTGQNCAYCDLNTLPYYGGCNDNYEKWLSEEAEPEKKVKSKKTQPRIVVYRDGDTVTVKDLETGEEASAVCSKKDTFDLHTGAFIAMSRLTHFDMDIRLMRLEMDQIDSYISDIKIRFGALMGEGYKYPDFDEEEEE